MMVMMRIWIRTRLGRIGTTGVGYDVPNVIDTCDVYMSNSSVYFQPFHQDNGR